MCMITRHPSYHHQCCNYSISHEQTRPDLLSCNCYCSSRISTSRRYHNSQGSWTIRFSLARREHLWWAAIALALVASFGCMVLSFLVGNNDDSLGLIILLASASSLAVSRYAWHTKKTLVPDDKTGLYAPIHPEKSASLLWGFHIGFTPRVSRGILAVPQRLLRSSPLTSSGHDGQPVCLAHGILARNKGFEPHPFILGLNPGTLEEKCVQWPRPSKVLRTYYREEMNAAYGGLGPVFVNVATELALLLADSSHSLIEDWLSLRMEHQDLVLNNQLTRLGASDEELKVLYRLSYAAMLVSLSAHRKGRKWRSEIKLFTAYWKKRKGGVPAWMGAAAVVERIGKEESGAGDTDLDALIEAVLCKIDTPRSV
ncbi:hypothetical protein DFJ58DRAFT_811839 [Suillus subalutaceus]|uniref:uncharacterized protein n=1 Tax=Suillus subalutaceus TaxID=48586 RepID=UPI001B85F5A0|nr:uncharacterized protein DFJ58DRAFT_811839 [Suillus subalutaceus]KAG1839641.1 hypothetical protein DFJ58DRAFT_811839 [Suillus subalutaceus]